MGALQMAESELSGNTISKEQEKPRKPSTGSSQSPKAAPPSCLRGAFIRIFPKRAQPNNKTEEDPSRNQNTEDQGGVKGKKRRVTGSIFRLPCLRPAETTGNDIQDNTEEQCNDVVQEEELKPYSKASFLRKIRCYRLMREKDATEKEKVLEMAQRKHDRETAEVRQHKERVLEQSEEGPQSVDHDEVVGGKGKDTTEQECHAKGLGEASCDFQEQDVEYVEQESSLRKEKGCTEKLHGSGEESMKTEDHAEGLEGIGKDLADQGSCGETLIEKSVLLEGEVSPVDDKNLAEQESQKGKGEQKEHELDGGRDQKEDVLEQMESAATVREIDIVFLGDVSKPEEKEKHSSNEEEGATKENLPKQESHSVEMANKEDTVGTMQKSENRCPTDELGDDGNDLSEQGHKENVGNTENNLSAQCLEEDTRSCLSKHNSRIEVKEFVEKDVTERNSQGDIADKLENNESCGEKEGCVEVGGNQENLVDQDSQEENTRKDASQQGSQYIMDTQAETMGEFKDNTEAVSRVSSSIHDEHNFKNNMSTQGLTMTISNQESVISETNQPQDSPAKRTLGSEDNDESLVSVRKKTSANDIITFPSSEEALAQKEVLTLTNAMDPQILHTYINNEDADGMGCENEDLGSLREEVKDMVEWLVQEASGRLSHYRQEEGGTG